nr:hypothetical protein [Tanacetum cinerariifolium]
EQHADPQELQEQEELAALAKMNVPKVVGKAYKYVEASLNGTKVRALVDSSATYNFMFVDEGKRLEATKYGGKTCMVSMERDSKCAARPFWPCNSKNGTTRVSLAFTGDKARDVWESSKVEVPKEIEKVLDELKYVMTKMLPSMREVDHAIKL